MGAPFPGAVPHDWEVPGVGLEPLAPQEGPLRLYGSFHL